MFPLLRAFEEGGSLMWAVLAVDAVAAPLVLLALILAVVGRFSRPAGAVAAGVGFLALAAALGAAITGIAGKAYAMSQVEAALANADPAQRPLLRAEGEREASFNTAFGVGSAVVLGLPAAVALVGALALRKPAPPA